MTDVFTKKKRSEVMSRIRSKGNEGTELALIKIFRKHGINGWRRQRSLFGKPDFVFRQKRVCVFVDGCFWHGCPRCYHAPNSNSDFWKRKYQVNLARDKRVNQELRKLGWKVIRIWEHELRENNRRPLMRKLRRGLALDKRNR